MNSFIYIITKLFPDINTKVAAFHISNHNKLLNQDFIGYGFINALQFKCNQKLRLDKYDILNSSILKNKFICVKDKERILNKFYLAQRIYLGFSRLAYLYRFRKSKTFDINTDLCMIPLSNFKSSMITIVFDNIVRIKYYYRTSDLINIINTALTHSPDFFVEPYMPKNPYTNIKFTTSQMLNIYFSIKNSNYIMPFLLQRFFMVNFNIQDYISENECIIRDYAITNFMNTSNNQQKYYYTKDMLFEYKNYIPSIAIHSKFPIEKISNTFEKHLKEYLISKYSFGPVQRMKAKRKLQNMLRKFNKLNPTYGRKIFYSRRFGNSENTIILNTIQQTNNDTSGSNHYFVDHVFMDSPRNLSISNQYTLMGLSPGQSIVPPLTSHEEETNNLVPQHVRDNLDRIINGMNDRTVIGYSSDNIDSDDEDSEGSLDSISYDEENNQDNIENIENIENSDIDSDNDVNIRNSVEIEYNIVSNISQSNISDNEPSSEILSQNTHTSIFHQAHPVVNYTIEDSSHNVLTLLSSTLQQPITPIPPPPPPPPPPMTPPPPLSPPPLDIQDHNDTNNNSNHL